MGRGFSRAEGLPQAPSPALPRPCAGSAPSGFRLPHQNGQVVQNPTATFSHWASSSSSGLRALQAASLPAA